MDEFVIVKKKANQSKHCRIDYYSVFFAAWHSVGNPILGAESPVLRVKSAFFSLRLGSIIIYMGCNLKLHGI